MSGRRRPELIHEHWLSNQTTWDERLEELLPSRVGPDEVLDDDRIEHDLQHHGLAYVLGRRL